MSWSFILDLKRITSLTLVKFLKLKEWTMIMVILKICLFDSHSKFGFYLHKDFTLKQVIIGKVVLMTMVKEESFISYM